MLASVDERVDSTAGAAAAQASCPRRQRRVRTQRMSFPKSSLKFRAALPSNVEKCSAAFVTRRSPRTPLRPPQAIDPSVWTGAWCSPRHASSVRRKSTPSSKNSRDLASRRFGARRVPDTESRASDPRCRVVAGQTTRRLPHHRTGLPPRRPCARIRLREPCRLFHVLRPTVELVNDRAAGRRNRK